jgi:Flp pilus assembly protein CpaB
MLRGIQVLAISGDPVVSKPEEEGGVKIRTSHETRVTLLVTPKQAEALKLAVENGSISLTIRNPNDKAASRLIAQIPKGMRAFSLFPDKVIPDRALLTPGCIVDVLVSYKLLSHDSKGESLSTTMFREIRVLAVSGELVATEPTKDGEEKETTKSKGWRIKGDSSGTCEPGRGTVISNE